MIDRIPADGIVRAGRSSVDESSFTGEPLPVTKELGSEVAAGSINLNGTLTIEVRRPGGETAIGDIIRLVEEAQSREAPVQRLADKVAGYFTYGVMAISVTTFTFWSVLGPQILPPAVYQGSAVSLALQLACSVLVIACPCALGLATPTAVLVGTSLGAKRGLLLRGGNILEKFALVNTVVFDKTGTLTIGKPVVTKIVTPTYIENANSSQTKINALSDIEVLRLAAAVESNSVHPVGKAIVGAAQAVNCHDAKVTDETFLEEPGSGVVATVNNKKVSVGTLEWITSSQVSQLRLTSIKTTARAAAGPWSEPLPETHAPPPVSDTANLCTLLTTAFWYCYSLLRTTHLQQAYYHIVGNPSLISNLSTPKTPHQISHVIPMCRHGVNSGIHQEVERKNQSFVYVGVDDTLAGQIYFEDEIRKDARHVVDTLSKQGIDVYMLSGDKRNAAEYVASLVGIPKAKVLSEVKPEEKNKFIKELQKDKNIVAMVGDGINDAAALASSHIGIALGGGVGAASEVSSIVLMHNHLSQLLDALELSRLTMNTVKQNLWWAFIYNIVGIPIAAGALFPVNGTMLTPSIAGALMGLSSIGVMTNSLLLRFKFSLKQQQIHGTLPKTKTYVESDLARGNKKMKYSN
ncbi:copper-transporting ATPase chloroplastic-like [Trifolium pratense]|uniref:Copper-transporting ATPase chloroplastic-like n=1 Tax=Trifolium pratense TaxID=57577 RepID=A0A2K3NZH3_TRIPR|nr:copper-transporting ATPase chloroplastic-like [Trifolium pratense]